MTETPTWSTLDLDQSVALRTAAGGLARDLDGISGTEMTALALGARQLAHRQGRPQR